MCNIVYKSILFCNLYFTLCMLILEKFMQVIILQWKISITKTVIFRLWWKILTRASISPPGTSYQSCTPPLCQVSCAKNWTKLFRFLVCEIRRLGICYKAPPPRELGGTPHGLREETMNSRNIFRKKSMLGRSFMYLCRYYVCRYVCCTMLQIVQRQMCCVFLVLVPQL